MVQTFPIIWESQYSRQDNAFYAWDSKLGWRPGGAKEVLGRSGLKYRC